MVVVAAGVAVLLHGLSAALAPVSWTLVAGTILLAELGPAPCSTPRAGPSASPRSPTSRSCPAGRSIPWPGGRCWGAASRWGPRGWRLCAAATWADVGA
ncbi:hypothetical protein [Pseudonocardia xishanensis]|uniref:hypothetical protein n=1 Tax=Pseudonocardia xishanensis TaxID=630995 RepID=UPI0031EF5534